MEKYILIRTDGYAIETKDYDVLSDAQGDMNTQYEEYDPDNLEEEWADLSYCGEMDAILYNRGEDVIVWKIAVVSFK